MDRLACEPREVHDVDRTGIQHDALDSRSRVLQDGVHSRDQRFNDEGLRDVIVGGTRVETTQLVVHTIVLGDHGNRACCRHLAHNSRPLGPGSLRSNNTVSGADVCAASVVAMASVTDVTSKPSWVRSTTTLESTYIVSQCAREQIGVSGGAVTSRLGGDSAIPRTHASRANRVPRRTIRTPNANTPVSPGLIHRIRQRLNVPCRFCHNESRIAADQSSAGHGGTNQDRAIRGVEFPNLFVGSLLRERDQSRERTSSRAHAVAGGRIQRRRLATIVVVTFVYRRQSPSMDYGWCARVAAEATRKRREGAPQPSGERRGRSERREAGVSA